MFIQVARVLVTHGAHIDVADIVKFSPLHIACYFGHEKVSNWKMLFKANLPAK